MEKENSLLSKGLKDGLPIGLGYLPLAFTLGVAASTGGFPLFTSIVMAMLSFTGVGQMNGMALMAAQETYWAFFIALLVINLRNIVLSLSLSQRLEQDIPLWKKLIISMGNTDEIFALSIKYKGQIPANYFLGVMTIPYAAWFLGTLVGGIATNLVPQDICIALKMALYAMLIASVVPAMKKTKPVLFVALISAALSWLMQINSSIENMFGGKSGVLVIGSIFSALIMALIAPVKDKKEEE